MNLRNFNPNEFDNFEVMNEELLRMLDEFRDAVDSRIIITSSTNGIHEPNSAHYVGRAVDIILPDRFKEDKTMIDIFNIANDFNFTGIGIYPHWKYRMALIGGFHLDVKVCDHVRKWIGVNDDSNKQIYLPFSDKNIKKYLID